MNASLQRGGGAEADAIAYLLILLMHSERSGESHVQLHRRVSTLMISEYDSRSQYYRPMTIALMAIHSFRGLDSASESERPRNFVGAGYLNG